VLETARGGLLRAGMGYRRCDVAACLNVKSDHLGLRGVETLEELAKVKRIPIEVARDTAVLNADDPLCLGMADYTEAKTICYVTLNPEHQLVREHIRAGGRALALEAGVNGQMITIYDKGGHIPLLWTHLIPATLEGRAMHNVQNAMFAAAMAFSMGVKLEDIRHGLRTFDTTFFQAPGRMNVFDEHGFKVILDYGHNPDAVEVMCQLTDRIEVKGKKLVVLAGPGDRRDEDIRDIARRAAGRFTHYYCRRDDSLRGRTDEEVPRLLRATLLAAGVPDKQITVIADEQRAVDTALRKARPGDLLLVFGDAIARTWKQIIHFNPAHAGSKGAVDSAAPPAGVWVEPPPGAGSELPDSEQLIRDERGVRLAREADD